jgi:hypothetical protein
MSFLCSLTLMNSLISSAWIISTSEEIILLFLYYFLFSKADEIIFSHKAVHNELRTRFSIMNLWINVSVEYLFTKYFVNHNDYSTHFVK